MKMTAKTKAKQPVKKRGVGKPSKCTPALVKEICQRLSLGEPLAQICRDKHIPCPSTIRRWADKDESISLLIARARDDGFDYIAADCFNIADDGTNDYMQSLDSDGAMAFKLNGEHIQRSKLRIDTRLKLLAKWNPKKYGDNATLKHSGDSKEPIQISITRKIVRPD